MEIKIQQNSDKAKLLHDAIEVYIKHLIESGKKEMDSLINKQYFIDLEGYVSNLNDKIDNLDKLKNQLYRFTVDDIPF